MFDKRIKIILALFLLVVSGWSFYEKEWGNGIFFSLVAGIVILFYYKNEVLIRAFLKLRSQNFDKAELLLKKIKTPERCLAKRQMGYYYYLKGLITSRTNIMASAALFKKALSLGLHVSYDVAMAKMNLAVVAMTKKQKREATNLINEVIKVDKKKLLAKDIKMMQYQLKRM